MSTIRVNEQTIYYDLLGKGEPLLLMHGWMQVGNEMRDLAKTLARHYRVILPDLPGYGRSVPPYREFPVDFYQRDAALMGQFLDALKLRNVHILGYSDGGEVALLLGITRPDLCRSVVVWGATGHFAPQLCDFAQKVIAPIIVEPEQKALHPKQDVSKWPLAWTEAFCGIIAAGGDLSLGRAQQLTAPLLLMVGDRDALNPADAARKFVDKVRETHQNNGKQRIFRLFAQTGHGIHEERPEPFIETVLDFLRQCG